MVLKKRIKFLKAKNAKKLIIERENGSIVSVTNPNAKTNKKAVLVQRFGFTGFTPISPRTNKRIRKIRRGRTERTAIKNVIKAGFKKVTFRD